MECGLHRRNGEVYAGATFKDRSVSKLAIFLGQNCNFSGRFGNTPIYNIITSTPGTEETISVLSPNNTWRGQVFLLEVVI